MQRPIYYYVLPEVGPGDIVRVGNFLEAVPSVPWRDLTQPIAVIHATEFSDFAGTSRERSNHAVLLDSPLGNQVVQIIGLNGYKALAYQAFLGPVPFCDELADIVTALCEWPDMELDEGAHLELQDQLEADAWNDHGRSDFFAALRSRVLGQLDPGFDHEIPAQDDGVDGPDLTELWFEGCSALGINGGDGLVFETGACARFCIEEYCTAALRAYPPESGGGRLIAQLAKLAIATRVVGSDEKTVHIGDVLELTADCALGTRGERCAVIFVGDRTLTGVFPDRAKGKRYIYTALDYRFFRRI